MCRWFALVVALLVTDATNAAVARAAMEPLRLRPGDYVWHPEVSPQGPVVIVVSLDEQRAYVYRNGIAIGLSAVSSGKTGHETPAGVFTILEKRTIAYSNLYDNAPMPFMERLTWDGVALHGGVLPGYPASHGCIRLPPAFAEKLYAITRRGATVIVASGRSAPLALVHPAMLAPEVAAAPADWYAPESAQGIGVLVSTADHSVTALQNGRVVFATRYEAWEPMRVDGSVVYVVEQAAGFWPSRLDAARPARTWSAYPIVTQRHPHPRIDVVEAFRLSDAAARRLYDLLSPGTTVLVTDLPPARAPSGVFASPTSGVDARRN
ncbi:MAG TPA: L,D-transpeptidase family protein [Rudaea sp.]